MKTLLNVVLSLLFLLPFACGQQLVEFGDAVAVGGAGGSAGSGGNATDVTAPTVTSSVPRQGEKGVARGISITADFSEAMNAATISASTFKVLVGTTPVAGSVTYSGGVATFKPTSDLADNAVHVATITTGATDLAGNALAADYQWTFTTEGVPTVTATSPADGATDVPPNGVVSATFSEAMAPATFGASTFTVTGPGTTSITGAVSYDPIGHVATFTPASGLAIGTLFTATITTGVTNPAGNALALDYVWTFTTTGAPKVTSTTPADLATDVDNGAVITATFNEFMDTSTILLTSFTVTGPAPGNLAVAGSVGYQALGSVATFTPTNRLPANTLFTARVTTAVKDALGIPLQSDFVWTFTSGETPSVVLESPGVDAVNVSNNTLITTTFSEVMDNATLTDVNFTVTGPGATPVLGARVYDAVTNILTFTPNAPLAANVLFTVTVTTGATDLTGHGLASDFVWTFVSGAPPSVLTTSPADGENDVLGTTLLVATFSEGMKDTSLVTSFTLKAGVTTIDGAVSYDPVTSSATFTPDAPLADNTEFKATISTAATDLDGNGLPSDFEWTFTTGPTPRVVSTNPANNDLNVALNKVIQATFSKPMDPTTIDDTTYTLTAAPGAITVTGTVTYNAVTHVASFTPDVNLDANTVYTATIAGSVTDVPGNLLGADFVWSFTTGTQSAQTVVQQPVPLGTSGHFVILASGAITNVPLSAITGDVGLTPTAGSGITGFNNPLTCPEVTGKVFTVDQNGPKCAIMDPAGLNAAQLDAGVAFINARAAVRGTATAITTNLAGLTLYPGLYESGTTLEFASGSLTLDAQGDSSAVFILRSANSITTQNASQVVLSKGAKATNVYWTAGSAITLGTTSIMKGTLIAATAISLLTGANLEGRALTQSASAAAVTLQSNIITRPIP